MIERFDPIRLLGECVTCGAIHPAVLVFRDLRIKYDLVGFREDVPCPNCGELVNFFIGKLVPFPNGEFKDYTSQLLDAKVRRLGRKINEALSTVSDLQDEINQISSLVYKSPKEQ